MTQILVFNLKNINLKNFDLLMERYIKRVDTIIRKIWLTTVLLQKKRLKKLAFNKPIIYKGMEVHPLTISVLFKME